MQSIEAQPGLPEEFEGIDTLAKLVESGYRLPPVREQLGACLTRLRQQGADAYPGIAGFEDDVIPALDRALLAGHDILLIGQIGQAKTRLAQIIAKNMLLPIPIVRGSITNDCPAELPPAHLEALMQGRQPEHSSPMFYASPESMQVMAEKRGRTPIEWRRGKDRYRYVLATPDLSVKDLVGHVDAIKVAKKGAEMYEIDSYSPGQLMQARHGIICIDELPVLDPRKQVALLSVLQEGRFTTGSYPVVFRPNAAVIATANPVDYTHSGKIIEPLLDRLGSHVWTRYPRTPAEEMPIILREARSRAQTVPSFVLAALATICHKARHSSQISQERGVSVRLGIHGIEVISGEAQRTRSLAHGAPAVPRLSDFGCLHQAAKFELAEADETQENRRAVLGEIIDASVSETCVGLLGRPDAAALDAVRSEFATPFAISQDLLWESYSGRLEAMPALAGLVDAASESEQRAWQGIAGAAGIEASRADGDAGELRAAVLEAVLEALCHTEPPALERKDAAYAPA